MDNRITFIEKYIFSGACPDSNHHFSPLSIPINGLEIKNVKIVMWSIKNITLSFVFSKT